MRRRFAVPLIATIGIAPWLWFYPDAPPDDQPAKLLSVSDINAEGDWLGGLSGFDLNADGSALVLVTDRGHIARATISRSGTTIDAVEVTTHQPLVDRFGAVTEFPSTDAEGVALDADGRVYVSFEHAHRVLVYDTWDSPAKWPSYSRAWRALPLNQGLEALAIADDGTLYTIPEEVNPGAWESHVYRRKPEGNWQLALTLPVDPAFAPVGADFGPDGRLYVLERGMYPFGFFSRVRAMQVADTEITHIETVLHTAFGQHGNLEGLSVWRDAQGMIRLTMVSDDNFLFFMRGQIVEYGIQDRVAHGPE